MNHLHVIVDDALAGFQATVAVTAGGNVQLAEDQCFHFGALARGPVQDLRQEQVGVAVAAWTAGNAQDSYGWLLHEGIVT